MGKHSKENKKNINIKWIYKILILFSIFLLLGTILAFFSDYSNNRIEIKSSKVNVEQTLKINNVAVNSTGLYIEPGEIKKVSMEVSNSDIKVRLKAFIRIEMPPGTPIESISAIRVYANNITDEDIKADNLLPTSTIALQPTILNNTPENPVVMQYEITNGVTYIEANEVTTLNAKVTCPINIDAAYQRTYANIYSTVAAVQYNYTQDSDVDSHIPEHVSSSFSTAVVPTGITLNESNITITGLMQGKLLEATIVPEAAYNRQVIWTSSNPGVATVDQNGIVVSRSVGITTITAKTYNNKSTTCIINVVE